MSLDLTDEEREFLLWHEGSIWSILEGVDGVKGDALDAAETVFKTLAERYPSRTERLLVFSALTQKAKMARDNLLRDIIRSSFHWVEYGACGAGDWRSGGVESWELQRLASLSGLSRATLRKWMTQIATETMEAAIAEEALIPSPSQCVTCGTTILRHREYGWMHVLESGFTSAEEEGHEFDHGARPAIAR